MASDRALRAEKALEHSRVMKHLRDFSPTVVSTLWVGLDTEFSDIDIVCCYAQRNAFIEKIHLFFSHHRDFGLSIYDDHTVARFYTEGFPFEIYGSTTAIAEQNAYRHFKIMERLVNLGGDALRSALIALKRQGLKTEPAIAELLSLSGDPFHAVLALETLSDSALETLIVSALSHSQR